MATSSSTTKTIVIKVEGGQAIASMNNVTLSTKELNTELLSLSQNAGKGKATSGATGGATATVMELGRTISDSNYGIRGMANNVSQLASNFLFMTRKVDETTKKAIGFRGALNQIGSTILGPLGILLAIQTVIALLEKWSMRTKEAEANFDSFNEAASRGGSELKVFLDQLDKGNLSLEETEKIVSKVNKEYRDLNIKIKDNGELTDESRISVENKIKSLERLARASALLSIIEEQQGEILKQEIKVKEKTEELESKYSKAEILRVKAKIEEYNNLSDVQKTMMGVTGATDVGTREGFIESDINSINKYQDKIDELKIKVSEITNMFGEEGLTSYIFNGGSNSKGKGKKDKIIKQPQLFDGDDLLENFDKNQLLLFDLQRRYLDSRAMFYGSALIQASDANNEILRKEIEHSEKMTLLLTQEGSMERIEAEANLSAMRMQLMDQEFEHELMLIDARKNAQMTYVGFIGQLGGILGDIAGKNKELAMAALVMEKGAAIAGIVVQASASIAQRTAANAAIPAFLPPGIPNPTKIADTALMAKDIALTKVSAGLSIAAILASAISGGKKNVPSSRGGSTSAGAVGGGDRTFDFNLVGSTGTNQLAEAVGSQFQEPVQAYVVSSQMTSQQELDLQISSGASLGGD